MFKLFGQRRETKEQRRKQLERGDFSIVKDELEEEPAVDFVNDLVKQQELSPSASVRSILKTAIKSADQIVDNIKMRARAEAEEEAARIIAQAKQEAEEIRGRTETVAEEKAEDIISVAEKVTEEKVDEPAQLQEKATGERIEEPVLSLEEAAVSEPVVAMVEESLGQRSLEKRRGRERTGPSLTKEDRNSLYTGEVELAIDVPVDPNMVAKLYNYLQTTPEIKFVRTSGSWNRGTTITVVLDKPIPLISVISSKIPEAEVTPEQPGKDDLVKLRKGARKINLALKEG